MDKSPEQLRYQPTAEVLTELTMPDLVGLCEIMPAAFASIHPEDIAHFVPQAIAADSADIVVARNPDGKIVSAMAVNLDFGMGKLRGWIDDVATREDHRQQGYASCVLDYAIDWCRERGVQRVNLTSGDDKQPAHRLYESRGFRIHDTNKFQLDLS